MSRPAFKGGVHPHDRKEATREKAIRRGPVPERLVIPMSQHLGAACSPVVSVGDDVARGQVVGDVDATVSAPVHSPVAGVVKGISQTLLPSGVLARAVEISPSPDQQWDVHVDVRTDSILDTVRAAGLVGMGGATFPTRVKLAPPKDTPVSTVILNGCECEPFLTCDHRLMVERPDAVIAGGRLIRDVVGASRTIVAVEDNKQDAAARLAEHADNDCEVLVLNTRYPQGAEKQLIWSTLGKEVPHGKLPAATGALVHNVGTAAAVADAVERGKPLIERVVTVTGAVAHPGNYLTLIGTPVSALLEAAGGIAAEGCRVVAGGPMTGFALASLDVPITKGIGGIVVLRAAETAPAVLGDQPCIRCGRCSDACPMALAPYVIGIYANRADWDSAGEHRALDCIECGCCSYACPTRRPLVQLIRAAKRALMAKGSV